MLTLTAFLRDLRARVASAAIEEPSATLEDFADRLRPLIADDLHGLLKESAEFLIGKLEGAVFVLRMDSPDAVSQAANSLIELVDRLLREESSEDEIVTWVACELPERQHLLTHQDQKDGLSSFGSDPASGRTSPQRLKSGWKTSRSSM